MRLSCLPAALAALLALSLAAPAQDLSRDRTKWKGVKTERFYYTEVRDDDPWLVEPGRYLDEGVIRRRLCADREWLLENGLTLPPANRAWKITDPFCTLAWSRDLWKHPPGHDFAGLNRYAPYGGMGAIWVPFSVQPDGTVDHLNRLYWVENDPVIGTHFGEEISSTCATAPSPVNTDPPDEQPVDCGVSDRLRDWGSCTCQEKHGSAYDEGLLRWWERDLLTGGGYNRFDTRDVKVRTVTDHCYSTVNACGHGWRVGGTCNNLCKRGTASISAARDYCRLATPAYSHSESASETRHTMDDPSWPGPCSNPPDPINDDPNCSPSPSQVYSHSTWSCAGHSVTVTNPGCLSTTTVSLSLSGTSCTGSIPNHYARGTSTYSESASIALDGECACSNAVLGANDSQLVLSEGFAQQRKFCWQDRQWAVPIQNPRGTFIGSTISRWWGDSTGNDAGMTKDMFDDMRGELVYRNAWPDLTPDSHPPKVNLPHTFIRPATYTVELVKDWHDVPNGSCKASCTANLAKFTLPANATWMSWPARCTAQATVSDCVTYPGGGGDDEGNFHGGSLHGIDVTGDGKANFGSRSQADKAGYSGRGSNVSNHTDVGKSVEDAVNGSCDCCACG